LGLLLLLASATAAASPRGPLDAARQMAAAGATELALRLLETGQPALHEDPEAWLAWERERVALLTTRKAWTAIAERLASLPEAAPAEFRQWADATRAAALLSAGEPGAARELAARLIWGGADAGLHQSLRRLVIRSYLAERRPNDAYSAMLRFRHDYGNGSREEALLRARVLLANELPSDALHELAPLASASDREAEGLALLARLRSERSARRVLQGGEQLLADPTLAEPLRLFVSAVLAEAAQQAGDAARAILAWEQLLTHPQGRDAASEELFPRPSDRLWSAYLDYATRVANREQLLIGDDSAWLALAATDSQRFPVRARSLRAAVALQGTAPSQVAAAHAGLVDGLAGLPGGEALLRALYVDSSRFVTPAALPVAVRYRLADDAVTRADLKEAARLLEGLARPPGGADAVAWQLRRARILVLGGEPARGAALLAELAAGADALTPLLRDRLVQVVFDLQSLGQHEAAYDVLARLLAATESPQVGRELLFWMADSRRAQERHLEAGRLYLESALALGPEAMDPWSQTARYKAAQALGEAGLLADAQALFASLLAITADGQRRAALQHELDRLARQHDTREPSP
jgi:hypothetical protein